MRNFAREIRRPTGDSEVNELPANWDSGTRTLNFVLGPFHLFSIRFGAMVYNGNLLRYPDAINTLQVEKGLLPVGIEAYVVDGCTTAEGTPKMCRVGEFVRYVPSEYLNYYADLQMSFDDYLQQLSSKFRKNLRREVRKFAEISGGAVEWACFRTPKEMLQFFHLAREVSKKTYQERLLNEGMPSSDEFVSHMLQLAECGSVRGYILFHAAKPVAFVFCPIRDGVVIYDHIGFDPEYREYSPGVVLQYFIFESLMGEQKHRLFDFGAGEGQHKQVFATGSACCCRVYFFRRNWRNYLLVICHLSFYAAVDSFIRILDRLGIKKKLRRFLRQGSSHRRLNVHGA